MREKLQSEVDSIVNDIIRQKNNHRQCLDTDEFLLLVNEVSYCALGLYSKQEESDKRKIATFLGMQVHLINEIHDKPYHKIYSLFKNESNE